MKKLNTKGFTHHLVMFAILAIVLGAMGFAGYRVYQSRNIDAQAYKWSSALGVGQTSSPYVCKTDLGGYWLVRAYHRNPYSGTWAWSVSGANGLKLGGSVGSRKTSKVYSATIRKAGLTTINGATGTSNKGAAGSISIENVKSCQ